MNKVNFKSIEAFSLVELSSAEISEINGGREQQEMSLKI